MARLSALCFVLVALALTQVSLARAEEQGDDRGVRILDQPTTEVPDGPKAPPVGAGFDVRAMAIKTNNSAGLNLDIVPGQEFQIGTRVAVRVATKRPGYLILVDIDAAGKLTQIFPNRYAMLQRQATAESMNLVKPGRPITIPDTRKSSAGFEFVAAPPAGVAMLVAILSDHPVQMIDLPDLPPPLEGQTAFDKLYEVARNLRIPSQDDSGALQDPKWSFEAKLYLIK
jgi:Domain of unknown function (DUF4384)